MFKQRLLTALILIPLILGILYYGNFLLIECITIFLALACGYEWMQLIPLSNIWSKCLFMAALLILCILIPWVFFIWLNLGIIIWVLIVGFILSFPASKKIWGYSWVVAIFSLVLLPLFSASILNIFLMPSGRFLLIFLLLLVWAADMGAYIFGKVFGKHKLIPKVSPGKTWEGGLGGFLSSLLIALIAKFFFKDDSYIPWLLAAVSIFVVALFGDLFISLLKRRSCLKDTGQLLPGHGGILDRLDSLIAAAPFFYLGLHYLSQGM